MRKLIFALALSAATVGAAHADDTSSKPRAEAATVDGKSPPPKDPNKIVCKTEELVGSRLPRRVCLRQSEMDKIAADSRRLMEERERNRAFVSPDK